jgi:dTDP-4-dehydrorhamnose reductase
MKVLLTGAGGQLGSALLRSTTAHQVRAFTRQELDIADASGVAAIVQKFKPDVIVNAAAYTAVDKAETESELAFRINAEGTENLGKTALQSGARLIHISTDFVFDGKKSSPYLPADEMHPLGVYGASKAEGERRLREAMGDAAVIIRTGWVYAVDGHNFVKTILRLLAEKTSLSVIADQIGTPTWAQSLADIVWRAIGNTDIKGTFHWSDAGVASWYDFAVAIQDEALQAGLLKRAIPVRPIRTEDYPLPAKRPPYSVLDKHDLIDAVSVEPVHWRANLRTMLGEFTDA